MDLITSLRLQNEDYVLNKPLWSSFHRFCLEIYAMKSGSTANPDGMFGQIARQWPMYTKMRQQDSHEFLRLFLEALDEEQFAHKNALPKKSPKNDVANEANVGALAEQRRMERKPRWMETIFGGKLLSSIKCRNCQHISRVEEPFMDLSLAVSPSPTLGSDKRDSLFAHWKNKWLPGFLNYSSIPLESLLEGFVQVDPLNEHPCYECENCSKIYLDRDGDTPGSDTSWLESVHGSRSPTRTDKEGRPYMVAYRLAEKWERVSEFPIILVIHLNRFLSTGFRGRFSKDSSYVAYPELLHMNKYSVQANPEEMALRSPDMKHICYRLYATIVHCGHSAESGHYIAMIKADTDLWFRCSDSSVRPVAKEEVFAGDAYILFYQRMSA
jgi:ubiquitin C-terminal hydrolase